MNQKCPNCNSENTGILHDSDNLNSPVLFYCNNCDMEISEFCPFCTKTEDGRNGKVKLTKPQNIEYDWGIVFNIQLCLKCKWHTGLDKIKNHIKDRDHKNG